MSNEKWVSAGLVFLGTRDIDIAAAGHRASAALETLDTRVSETRVTSAQCCGIAADQHRIRLTLHQDHPLEPLDDVAACYLCVQVGRVPSDSPKPANLLRSDTILAHLLRELNQALRADYIKWIGPRALIPREDFVRATAQLDHVSTTHSQRDQRPGRRPHRPDADAAARLPRIDEHSERLDLILQREAPWAQAPCDQNNLRNAYRGPCPDQPLENPPSARSQDIRENSPILRLSTWLMSFAVALFCLPVGIALVIINLLRGENLRLASQAAALTGTFISLQVAGSMAQAAEVLQAVLS